MSDGIQTQVSMLADKGFFPPATSPGPGYGKVQRKTEQYGIAEQRKEEGALRNEGLIYSGNHNPSSTREYSIQTWKGPVEAR